MDFELAGGITNIKTIAVNLSIRDRQRLWRCYGKGRWRKLKGEAWVRAARAAICATPKSTGTKHTGSAKENSKSRSFWIKRYE